MDFQEFLNSILSNSWLTNIKDVLVVAATVVLTIISKRSKTKLDGTVMSNNKYLTDITSNVVKLTETIDSLNEKNKQLEDENRKIINGVKALGDIVGTSFLESKAISADTKLKIASAITVLKEAGLEVAQTADVILESAAEEIHEAQEITEQEHSEAKQQAEDTNEKALNLYNEILNNV